MRFFLTYIRYYKIDIKISKEFLEVVVHLNVYHLNMGILSSMFNRIANLALCYH